MKHAKLDALHENAFIFFCLIVSRAATYTWFSEYSNTRLSSLDQKTYTHTCLDIYVVSFNR